MKFEVEDEVITLVKKDGIRAGTFGIVESIDEATDKEEPVTEHVRVINFKRPIESVDLLDLKDDVEYVLSNENKTLTLRFKKKISAGKRIKFIENEESSESITLDKVDNVVRGIVDIVAQSTINLANKNQD